MNKWLKRCLLSLMALLLLPLLALALVLSSSSGNLWLLQQVPGLEVKGFEGRLLGQWSAEYLRWQDEQTSIELQQAQMQIQLSCLLEQRLCLQQLRVQQLALELAENQQQTQQPAAIELPSISLPLVIDIQWLELGSLYLNQQLLLQDVQLQAKLVDHFLLLEQLQLSHQQHSLVVTGQIRMQQDWPLSLQLQYAGSEQQLGQQQAQIQLEGSLHQLELNGKLHGALNGNLQAKAQPLDYPRSADVQLELLAEYGRLDAKLFLQHSQQLNFDAAVQVQDFNPAYLLPQLPGIISGQLHTKGSFAQYLQLQASAEFNGQLLGELLKANLQLSGKDKSWQLSALEAEFGALNLSAKASLDKQLEGDLLLQIPALTSLLPEAQGSAQLKLQLSGDVQNPAASLQLNGDNLAYQQQKIGQLRLSANGDLQQQQLDLLLDGQLQVNASLHGQLDLERLVWQGELSSLRTGVPEQQISLSSPMTIDYVHQKHLYLGQHCFVSGDGAQLCASQQLQLLPVLDLAYQLRDFPLFALQPWLTPELQIKGAINGQVRVQQQEQLRVKADLDAGQGELIYLEAGHEYNLGWQQLRLQTQLDEHEVNGKLLLVGRDTGRFALDVQLDPHSADKNLRGSFALQQLELQPLQAMFAQVEQLQGSINGSGAISGTLLQPQIDGQLALSQGLLTGQNLPLELRQLWLDVQFAQNMAKLTGGWHSGQQGKAQISGQIDWSQQLQVAVALQANQLPLTLAPYADLQLGADLQLSLAHNGLLLSGLLEVPSGQIKVPELPAQAVRTSADAQVIGREQPSASLPLALDLQIRVGQERLYFTGFGLSALVQGDMHMSDSMNGRGVLELKEGRYRAYGQRLQLRRARLVFSGPVTQPYIDIEAVRVTGDVTAGLRLSGLAEQPQTEIFSQPAMSQEQALSWLLLGRPLEGGGDDGDMMGQAALALGMLGTTPIANRMADAFGIKEFQLDTEGSGMETSVMASGRITDKLSVGYGVGVFQPGGIVALRYELTKRLYVEAASSLANSLDIFYRRSF